MTAPAPATAFELPTFWAPITPLANADTQAMAGEIGDWLQQTGVCPGAEQAALMGSVGAYGTAATIPCATGLSARTMARYMAWGFALDDECERAGASEDGLHQLIRRAARLVQIMETPDALTPDDDVWVRAWADIVQDLHTIAHPSALRRAIDGFRGYALGVVHEASLQRTATLPSLEDYLAFRYAHGAGAAVAAMVEISTGVDIPAHEIDSPAAIAASQTAVTIVQLDNELLSRHKETEGGEYDCSLVRVLQNEDPHLTLQEAVDTANALRNRILDTFLKLRDTLHPGASPQLRTYLDALGHLIAGVTMWSATSPRYTSDTSPTDELRLSDTDTDRHHPLTLPMDIARWNRFTE
ncbi:terpene synthase family protein [Streptomyces sp. NBC_01276]|uniref:terpene synthase family protein n=1 Tax=Streptomyces sp. NBC_01276 TaxID=2903808 RepID=UPI002F919966